MPEHLNSDNDSLKSQTAPANGAKSRGPVFQKLADNGQSLALLMRYEGALNRSYDRAFKQLLLLQAHRPRPNEPKPAQATPCEPVPDRPNEPKPVPAPASVPVAPTALTPASERRNDPRIQKDEFPVDAG